MSAQVQVKAAASSRIARSAFAPNNRRLGGCVVKDTSYLPSSSSPPQLHPPLPWVNRVRRLPTVTEADLVAKKYRTGRDIVSLRRLFSSTAERCITSTDVEVNEANKRCSGTVRVQKASDGVNWGVFSSRSFAVGDIVIESNVLLVKADRCSHSIQFGWDEHIMMDLPANFLNHACDPNVCVKNNSNGSYNFVALKNISEGDEIRFDYETTEYEISAFDKCLCGVETCRGRLSGFKSNGQTVREKYGSNVAPYLID